MRAVSPANRSDGFLGSDMSQDDGPFFDGKPEDFTWTLKGEADQLRVVDPLSLQGKSNSVWVPAGGWRANWAEDLKIIGYQDPTWKGLAWAPRSAALAKRRFWIVEGVPKDRYYLYGKLELYIDKETYQGAWNRKFSWQGELLNTLQVMAYQLQPYTRPDGTGRLHPRLEHVVQRRREHQGQSRHRRRTEIRPEVRARRPRAVRPQLLRHELPVALREVGTRHAVSGAEGTPPEDTAGRVPTTPTALRSPTTAPSHPRR